MKVLGAVSIVGFLLAVLAILVLPPTETRSREPEYPQDLKKDELALTNVSADNEASSAPSNARPAVVELPIDKAGAVRSLVTWGSPERPTANSLLGLSLPIPFVPNVGQWEDDSFLYLAKFGPNSEVVIDSTGWRIAFFVPQDTRASDSSADAITLTEQSDERSALAGVLLRYSLVKEEKVSLHSGTSLSWVHNYFLTRDPERWKGNVPVYASVAYRTSSDIDCPSHGGQPPAHVCP